MKLPLVIAILVAGAVVPIVGEWGGDTAVKLYGEKLQMPMFTGFLTLAGFILSLKTNILLRLQNDLFDKPLYKERIERASALEGQPISRFEPLINLGNYLVWTVFACLAASLAQVTFGFIKNRWSVGVALAAGFVAFVFTLFAWFAIRANLQVWFDLLKEGEQAEQKKKTESVEASK